jgi:protein-S-isoprenylcysteine O-methyltransferase Ste14
MAVLGMASTFGMERKRSGTSGDEGVLVRRGPYRFSRNPQYVGFIIGLIGWAFVTSSALTLVVSLVGVVPLVLVPFAEEPWLAAKYGSAYEEYRRAVPRFISFNSQNDVH